MKFKILALLLFFSIGFHAYSQNKADDIVGVWLTSGKKQGKIQIYKSGDRYYGKVVWLKYPTKDNKPLTDIKNPEQEKVIADKTSATENPAFQYSNDFLRSAS